MYAEITAAIQSTKTVAELLKAAKSLSNYSELVAAVSEVNSKLMEATAVALASQEAHSRLLARVAELEAEINQARGWEAQAGRYSLKELAPGLLAYSLRPEAADGEPLHWLCANCMADQRKSLLQMRSTNEFGKWYICHNCKSEIHIDSGYRPPAPPPYEPF